MMPLIRHTPWPDVITIGYQPRSIAATQIAR
jgi:hypothetical protein